MQCLEIDERKLSNKQKKREKNKMGVKGYVRKGEKQGFKNIAVRN